MVTVLDRVNRAILDKEATKKPFRDHLGGSMIGKKCERELFYNFRWAKRPSFGARMLRLFDRGHKEEFRFVQFLRDAGIVVREYSQRLCYHAESKDYFLVDWGDECVVATVEDVTGDPAHVTAAEACGMGPKQWRISDVNNHYGGSTDGESDAPFDLIDSKGRTIPANTPFLNEFKTHSFKSFMGLVNAAGAAPDGGVKEAKPVHWAQMQTYMHKRNLNYALYMAVNKNDDDLYMEIVYRVDAEGPALVEKAIRVISSTTAPNRIGKHPSWYDCKFCEYIRICHYGEAPDRNCRSCRNSSPALDGQWKCNLWNMLIPSDAILSACDNYQAISD